MAAIQFCDLNPCKHYQKDKKIKKLIEIIERNNGKISLKQFKAAMSTDILLGELNL